jgi:hypothetical protein
MHLKDLNHGSRNNFFGKKYDGKTFYKWREKLHVEGKITRVFKSI